MRGRGKFCAARPREQGRQAVSEIRRAVSMKIAVKESKRGNIAVMRKRQEAEDSQSEERS